MLLNLSLYWRNFVRQDYMRYLDFVARAKGLKSVHTNFDISTKTVPEGRLVWGRREYDKDVVAYVGRRNLKVKVTIGTRLVN